MELAYTTLEARYVDLNQSSSEFDHTLELIRKNIANLQEIENKEDLTQDDKDQYARITECTVFAITMANKRLDALQKSKSKCLIM